MTKGSARSSFGLSRTSAALIALAAGVALGIALHGWGDPRVGRLVAAVAAAGQVWVTAIRLTVIPLIVTLTLAAIVNMSETGSVGALGARTLVLFVVLLVGAGIVTLMVAAPAVALYPVDAESAASLRTGPAPPPEVDEAVGVGDSLKSLLPTNLFQAAAKGEILAILLFTVLFALACTRLPPGRREPLGAVFQGLADAMLVVVGWILRILPLGVFALCLDFAFRSGARSTGVIAAWILIVSGVLVVVTLLLYPVSTIFGRVPMARFARAVAPAQLVAVSTRSSLASLPALVRGSQKHLLLPASATGLVLPLCVTALKLDCSVGPVVQLLFLAHVFQVPLGLGQIASFFLIQLILSFSAAGIPSMGTLRSLPAYLAVGIPIEAIFILNAVETIPDIFKTLLNVTGDMSAAVILSRPETGSTLPLAEEQLRVQDS
jgi:proton glutamate symport protein